MAAWSLCSTQLRRAGMDGTVTGLDYVACQIILSRNGLDDREIWEGLRIIESALLEHLSKKGA
jgi:hypothetical protein